MIKNISLCILCILSCLVSCTSAPKKEKVVVAYVTSWKTSLPHPTFITHINYAFGHVTDSFNGIRIDNEERLKQIVSLKEQKPTLNVLLSVGGWESGGFSEMAATEETRKAFAKDCQRVIDEFQLDGIDIDWEYPTSSVAGISSSPDDTDNFTLLLQEIRSIIGKNNLLTLATDASGKFIDFAAIHPYVDFVNIMTYDMAGLPKHHAPLFHSEMTSKLTCESSIARHVEKGMPIEKLVLGIPFFGQGTGSLKEFLSYRDIIALEGYTQHWDDTAKAPYLKDTADKVVCSYEDAESIRVKCNYLKEQGMLGAMYWEYDGDDEHGTLRRTIWEHISN